MSDLRKALEGVTRTEEDVSRHPELIADIPGHTILPLDASDWRSPGVDRYNCFAYAFNLAASPKFRAVASKFYTIHANEMFVDWLLTENLLQEIDAAAAKDGDVVIYFDSNGPTHAGKLFGGSRVVSKWGIGQLWEHGVFEVPAQYGGVVRYFSNFSPEAAEAAFLGYVRARGVEVERIRGWSAV